MIRRAPIATRTNTLFSYTTVCRYVLHVVHLDDGALGRQVAAQADDAAGRREGARAGPHNILVGRQGHALELLLDGLAGHRDAVAVQVAAVEQRPHDDLRAADLRSEEHTSELQSLMRISYAVLCLQKKTHTDTLSTD